MHSKLIGTGLLAAIAGVQAAPAGTATPVTAPAVAGDGAAAAAAANNAIAPMAKALFDYTSFTETRFLKYKRGTTDWDANTNLNYQFAGGETVGGQMDTGSVGMVIAAGNIPGYAAKKGTGRQDVMHYEPSGNTNFGEWVELEVTFPDIKATATVEVLAVTQAVVCKGYVRSMGMSCPSDKAQNIRNMPVGAPSMIGVGFARGKADKTKPVTRYNPLLNINKFDGKALGDNFCPGYILTKDGAHIGLTKANTAGFEKGTMKLQEDDNREGSDNRWSGPRANFKVNGGNWIPSGLLIDTGLNTMLSSAPTKYNVDIPRDDSGYLLAGKSIEVAIGPDPAKPIVHYTFNAGSASKNIKTGEAKTPSTADLAAPKARVSKIAGTNGFVNTGSRVLRAMDMLLDSKNGYYGLRSAVSQAGK